MAEAVEDVTFTFDTTEIIAGFKRVEEAMASNEKATNKMSKNMSGAMAKGMMKAGLAISALIAGAKKLVQIFAREMPEIGQTFKVAGSIFWKNFLWPIRQELMPLLQKLLNWTRDNRAMFVKWGQTVVTIFKTIISVVKFFVDILKSIGKNILSWLGFESLEEFINVLQFKIAAIGIGVKYFFEQIAGSTSGLFSGIGNLLEGIVTSLGAFFSGFLEGGSNGKGMQGLVDLWNSLVDAVSGLMTALGDLMKSEGMQKFMEFLGKIARGIFEAAIGIIVDLANELTEMLQWMDKLMSGELNFWEWLVGEKDTTYGNFDDLPEDNALTKTAEDAAAAFFNPLGLGGGATFNGVPLPGVNVDDAIITPRGEIIKTNPADYIIATKTPGAMGGSGMAVNIDMTGAQFVVTEGDAQATGENFASGMVNTFRDQIFRELEAQGA